jgi:hypothetical protein
MIIAGDAHGIVFGDGAEEDEPVGTMPEFLTGGGPRPLRLSVAAIAHVKKRLDSRA